MATGVTLSKLVKDLRAECGHSLAVAQGQATEETLRYMHSIHHPVLLLMMQLLK